MLVKHRLRHISEGLDELRTELGLKILSHAMDDLTRMLLEGVDDCGDLTRRLRVALDCLGNRLALEDDVLGKACELLHLKIVALFFFFFLLVVLKR